METTNVLILRHDSENENRHTQSLEILTECQTAQNLRFSNDSQYYVLT